VRSGVGVEQSAAGVADGWGSAEDEREWLDGRRALVEQFGVEPRVGDEESLAAGDDGLAPGNDDPRASTFAQQVRALVQRSDPDRLRLYGDEDPDVVAQARAIVGSEAFKQAVANPTCRRDVRLLTVIDGVVVDLVADLVYETPDGVILVSYDIARRPDGGGGAARGPAPHLAQAFERATGHTPVAIDRLNAADGSTTRLPLLDLNAAHSR
jgi:hypothetical protein